MCRSREQAAFSSRALWLRVASENGKLRTEKLLPRFGSPGRTGVVFHSVSLFLESNVSDVCNLDFVADKVDTIIMHQKVVSGKQLSMLYIYTHPGLRVRKRLEFRPSIEKSPLAGH
jgi:hypothetical protein